MKSDEPLFTLEQENEAAQRREAADRLARAQAQLANLQKAKRPTEIDAVRAELVQAEASLKLAEATSGARRARPPEVRFGERLDDARNQAARDRRQVEEMPAQLATAGSPRAPTRSRAAEAEVAAARAALAQADWRVAQKAQRARRTRWWRTRCSCRASGSPPARRWSSLLPPGNVKVRFFVPEAAARRARASGSRSPFAATAAPRRRRRRVSFIAPQAEYTPPVIYSRESRAKLVFMVEARPDAATAARLQPGQPVDVALRDVTPWTTTAPSTSAA